MKTGYMMMLALVSAGLTGCSYTTNKSFVQVAPPPVMIVDIPSTPPPPPPPVQVQTQQLQPTSQPTLVVAASGRPKLMLHLFCPECQEYYTWKGGVLPLGTQLYFWHPVAKEWRIYSDDYNKIRRPDHYRTDELCPNHRRR